MLENYFKGLYQRTMSQAYRRAHIEIVQALATGGRCLDCGANEGYWQTKLATEIGLRNDRYSGIEWSNECVLAAQNKGIQLVHGDLNKNLPFDSGQFACVFGLSVVEHLLNPCNFLREAHRVIAPGGRLVILTPNISTYFTAALILAGRMPSTGPHPDSTSLVKSEEIFKVSADCLQPDSEAETPVHRHLVVFSYKVLRRYLDLLGFRNIRGFGFGLYPFPNFVQPILEKLDPFHCHQMVFVAEK
jgi:2-polyprenyl-3-methyl-5-hydroxy-6-metoxy-1,4-benzoquinol methylase